MSRFTGPSIAPRWFPEAWSTKVRWQVTFDVDRQGFVRAVNATALRKDRSVLGVSFTDNLSLLSGDQLLNIVRELMVDAATQQLELVPWEEPF
jgi:hypothetical protein